MMSPRRLAAIFLLVVFLPVWPAPAAGQEEVEDIGIGVMLPLSGAMAAAGREQRNALTLELERFNAAGGVLGREIRLDIRDTAGVTDYIRGIMSSFISKKQYPVVIGCLSSESARLAARAAQGEQVVYVTLAPADDLAIPSLDHTFRVSPPASSRLGGLLDLLSKSRSVERVAVVGEASNHDSAVFDLLTEAAAARGWTITGRASYPFDGLDAEAIVGGLVPEKPDAVFMTAYGRDAADLVVAARDLMDPDTIIAGTTEDFASPVIMERPGEAAEGVLSASWWTQRLPDAGAREFAERYRSVYGYYPGRYGAEAAAALEVAVSALRGAVSWSAQDMTAYLAGKRFRTVMGTVRPAAGQDKTHAGDSATYAVQWQSGRPEVVWPPGARTSEPLIPGLKGGLTVVPGR